MKKKEQQIKQDKIPLSAILRRTPLLACLLLALFGRSCFLFFFYEMIRLRRFCNLALEEGRTTKGFISTFSLFLFREEEEGGTSVLDDDGATCIIVPCLDSFSGLGMVVSKKVRYHT